MQEERLAELLERYHSGESNAATSQMCIRDRSKDAPKTWLYLPAPDLHIKRSLVRAGIVDPADMRLSFQGLSLIHI